MNIRWQLSRVQAEYHSQWKLQIPVLMLIFALFFQLSALFRTGPSAGTGLPLQLQGLRGRASRYHGELLRSLQPPLEISSAEGSNLHSEYF